MLSKRVLDIIWHRGAIGEHCAIEGSAGSELLVGDGSSFKEGPTETNDGVILVYEL